MCRYTGSIVSISYLTPLLLPFIDLFDLSFIQDLFHSDQFISLKGMQWYMKKMNNLFTCTCTDENWYTMAWKGTP